MEFKRIAVDTSQGAFTRHGVDEQDRPILRQNLSRTRFEAFPGKMSPTEVVPEACGSSYHRAGCCGDWAIRFGDTATIRQAIRCGGSVSVGPDL
jgi:hypothetical protein